MKTKIILRAFVIVLGVVAAVVMVLRVSERKQMRTSTAIDNNDFADFGAVASFSLTERSGKKVELRDLKGQIWVANFIFTRCLGPCPVMSTHMAKLAKEFTATPNLKFVSFSVDPDYDKPGILKAYAEKYGADPEKWLFLTGESKQVYELIGESFRLAVEKNMDPDQKPGEQINHSLYFVLVDKQGHVRGYYNGNDTETMNNLRRAIPLLAAQN